MWAAPIGAFGAIAFTVGKFGAGSLVSLGKLLGEFYVVCLIFVFCALGPVSAWCGFSLFKLIRYIREELLIVFATTSSETVLPRMMAKMKDLGCEESVVGLVIPTGYSFNLDGTCLYLATAAVFLAQATNTPLDLTQQIGLLIVLLLTSKGAAGIAGAAFVVLAATLSAAGTIPVASVALVLGIHRLMSEGLTPTNLVGNAVATIVVAKWEGALDEAKLHNSAERPGGLSRAPLSRRHRKRFLLHADPPQIVNAEQVFGVGKDIARRPAGGARHLAELADRIFVRIFGMDRFAGIEREGMAEHRDFLSDAADDVHFDAPLRFVIGGLVKETPQVEITAELVVDAPKQIEIEGCGDAGRVVIGGQQNAQVLFQIGADHQPAVGAENTAHVGEQRTGIGAQEIADRRAGKEAELRALGQFLRQRDRAREITDDRHHRHMRKAPPQPRLRIGEGRRRDVDRHISGDPGHFGEQDLRLAARARAEFDDHAARGETGGEVGGMGGQDRGLGAGRIIFRQFGDLFEQGAAACVVEEAAGQRFLALRQSLDHGTREIVMGGAGSRRGSIREAAAIMRDPRQGADP